MRWREEEAPRVGDSRQRVEFLFLPLTIGGETRWLERGRWEEVFFLDGDWGIVRWTS